MTLLDALAEAGALAPLDVQVGRLLLRRAGDTSHAPLLAAAAARASAERRRGHACVALDALAEVPLAESGDGVVTLSAPLPPPEAWRAALAGAPALCGSGGTPTPLVLEGDRLYLHRYWQAERRLGRNLRRLLDAEPVPVPAAVQDLHATLFPAPADGAIDRQAEAARVALGRRLALITGGPGTGKTTTVARLLALLLTAQPEATVALAAPTGKAAARLREAIERQLATLPIDPALRARIPSAGRTLHRLLGYRPWEDRFGRDADSPLTEDIVVVDEASMADLLLVDALLDAVRPDARLILLGDAGQLASVEAGAVFGDLCRLAEQAPGALRDATVRLERSYRFEARPGIGAVATAVRVGDAPAALRALHDADLPEAGLSPWPDDPDAVLAPVAAELDAYLAATGPAEVLARLGAFRILCATYAGRRGVDAMTALVEQRLRRRGFAVQAGPYDHQPVLVTANDHAADLFNGDVGVVLVRDGVTEVHFPDGRGGVRTVTPARLPPHRSAWAMTVHKAQGSEFDRVLVALPDADTRVLTRELLYTAVTRARETVTLLGEPESIVRAVARETRRRSGLAAALGLPDVPGTVP